jgi:hypothetical protein
MLRHGNIPPPADPLQDPTSLEAKAPTGACVTGVTHGEIPPGTTTGVPGEAPAGVTPDGAATGAPAGIPAGVAPGVAPASFAAAAGVAPAGAPVEVWTEAAVQEPARRNGDARTEANPGTSEAPSGTAPRHTRTNVLGTSPADARLRHRELPGANAQSSPVIQWSTTVEQEN